MATSVPVHMYRFLTAIEYISHGGYGTAIILFATNNNEAYWLIVGGIEKIKTHTSLPSDLHKEQYDSFLATMLTTCRDCVGAPLH